ncbi:hypothetical protein BGZ96_009987 [Linnemannia gamsii]|uniref:DNA polymerase epsilon subunit D n=1 Tax=Linnemannia gamsii TaxID=64522 RepID=A0ABQ7JW04_9FUNG|nr:hypothetical protein BGZ96_009987 [Linnemannia gamsii]
MSTSIEDNELPKAILTRIMKQALPENTNIQANAKLAMTKSTTLFINYLTSAANEVAANAGHKIVSGAHVLKALEAVDLEEMLPRLTEELQAFQSIQRSKRATTAQAAKDKDSSSSAAGSKKRKPATDESSIAAKSRKSSTSANPRDGQDTPSDMLSDGENKEDDDEEEEEEEEEEEDDDNEEGDDADASESSREKSLNMNDQEQEEKQGDADEDDDSDGF